MRWYFKVVHNPVANDIDLVISEDYEGPVEEFVSMQYILEQSFDESYISVDQPGGNVTIIPTKNVFRIDMIIKELDPTEELYNSEDSDAETE